MVTYNGADHTIKIYTDGADAGGQLGGPHDGGHDFTSGRIVVGRYLTASDGLYSSVQVDELSFFNHELSLSEIESLYNSV